MGEPSPRGRRKQLARRFKSLRERSGMTLEEVCTRLRISRSTLNRFENGERLVRFCEMQSLLDLYGLTVDRWPEYEEMYDAAKERPWWRAYGVDDRGYVPLEADASEVREFSLGYIPGLLQTSDYAYATFRGGLGRLSGDKLRNAVTVRAIRRQRLTSADNPLRLMAVLDEAALYRLVGDRAVMAAQLAHLGDVAALDTVTLRILPTDAGCHAALPGSFSLLSFDHLGEPDMAYAEHPLGAINTDRAAMVRTATIRFDRLRSDALSPAESVALIQRAADRYEGPA
jgi:transcriptional regulator with XRE-family HTH domain